MTHNPKIKALVVEDEQTLLMIIRDALEEKGEFEVLTATNGEQGLEMFHSQRPEVVVTDVMMPRMDGFELVRHIRQSDQHTPILMLTARSGVGDVVEGFESGCNDYLKKPFGVVELIVRVKALVGHAQIKSQSRNDIHKLGKYTFDSTTQTLYFLERTTPLSHRESEILRRLCENRNRVLYTKNLLLELWGDDSVFNSNSLHVFITKLRKKLSDDPSLQILNVRGTGYKLIEGM